MKRLNIIAMICLALMASVTINAQEVIQLYDGAAPGSEDWDWDEITLDDNIAAVSHPTLTVYRPEKPNGVGMVVCPGGAFVVLAYKTEGEAYAKTLNEKGITCFMLKYRLKYDHDFESVLRCVTPEQLDSLSADVIPLALKDAENAIRYVRSHASEYGIDPDKIGICGSSAGGSITIGTCINATADDCRPNFAVGTYPYLTPHIGNVVPDKPLPLFIAATTTDKAVPVTHSLTFYKWWLEKGQRVEMHLFNSGEHGFVCKPQHAAVDNWFDNLFLWLKDIYPDNF